jgi:hypothetical protein
MQEVLFVENTALYLANRRLENVLGGEGDTAKRVILTHPSTGTYSPGTDINDKDLTGSNESLTVTTWNYASVYVDDTDIQQNLLNAGSVAGQSMQRQHNNRIEQAVLTEVTNSQWSLDAAAVNGASGSNIAVNTDNAHQIFTAANTKLNNTDAPMAGRCAVIGGHILEQLQLTNAGRLTNLGDNVLANGVVGPLFNWQIVYNNNLPYSATLTLSVQPTDGDTVTIAGVLFTFKSTLGTTAGNVHICSDATHTRATFAAALNAPDTTVASATDAGFVKVAVEDAFLLMEKRALVATDDLSTKITIAAYGDVTVASSFTSATNAWSAQRQDALFMVRGAIDLVVQIPTKVEVTRIEKRFGERVKSLAGFGKKTYADGARKMVRVKIDASTWV